MTDKERCEQVRRDARECSAAIKQAMAEARKGGRH